MTNKSDKLITTIFFVNVLIYLSLGCATNKSSLDERRQFTVDNPYETIDWEKIEIISSTTHIHLTDQQGLDKAYDLGYRHLPISNYYPSTPYYPPEKMKVDQFKVKQDFGAMKLPPDGAPYFVEGPIYWNDTIMNPNTGWYESLPEEQKDQMPFKVGGSFYDNIPKDVLFAPNAEHHAFTDLDANVHICAPGSFYSSGTFDARNRFRTFWGGGDFSYGTGLPWKEAFKRMLDNLQFEDGGGITINHPKWSKLDLPTIEKMLDYDPRVLGIEVIEGSFGGEPVYSTEIWDKVLMTGRKCLGFFVPDWGIQSTKVYSGFSMLLVNKATEHACLKAYREGTFFGSERGKDFVFTNISLKNNLLVVETNHNAKFSFIADGKEVKTIENSKRSSYKIPLDKNGIPLIKYVRVEAQTEQNGKILTQPIRFIKL